MLLLFSLISILMVSWYMLKIRESTIGEKVVILTLTISTLYYGVAGIWYWFEYREGVFLGVNWNGDAARITIMYFMCYIFSILSIAFFSKKFAESSIAILSDPIRSNRVSLLEASLWCIALFSAAYVLLQGGQAAYTNDVTSDPFLLIMLQFAMMLIPLLLFQASKDNSSLRTWLLISIYIGYCATVGLRTLAVLALFPLAVSHFMRKSHYSTIDKFLIAIVSVVVVFVFSVYTISRSKFEGIDLALALDADFEDMFYGFFAETNILFGLASSINMFGDKYDYVGWQPIFDSVIQFIPRFLYPEKNLYQHLQIIAYGLGDSSDAYASGTSQPFFAEYYAMGGPVGLVIGFLLYGAVVCGLLKMVEKYRFNSKLYFSWIGLIAIFFAYYYFSRGSVAQIFKGFIFIFLPFIFLSNGLIRKKNAFTHNLGRAE